MKTILVTGSRGFIGQHLCKVLNELGHHVIEADRKLGFDLSNYEDTTLLPDVDMVVHLVALSIFINDHLMLFVTTCYPHSIC